jgi:hypothetical protein
VAKALGGFITVKNYVYYRSFSNETFGAPWAPPESWTYTEEIVSDAPMGQGDKTTNNIPASLPEGTQEVTVPINGGTTFTCYVITITQDGKTITEYWDASGVFPYAPVKTVDNVNFESQIINQLYSSNVYP